MPGCGHLSEWICGSQEAEELSPGVLEAYFGFSLDPPMN